MNYKKGDRVYYERNDSQSTRPNGVYTVYEVYGNHVRIVEDTNSMFFKHMALYAFKPLQHIKKHEF